jgi:plasmid maintenance system antidote protein VapI
MANPKGPKSVTGVLKQSILQSGRSLSELGRATGVATAILSRFVRGQRGITNETVDKLCRELGLELVQRRRPRRTEAGGSPS